MYNKENLLNHIQKVKPEGFGLLKDSFGYVSSDVEQKVIYLATREYFPHGAYIFGASAHITFNEIENKLKPLYLAQGVKNSRKDGSKHAVINILIKKNALGQKIMDENQIAESELFKDKMDRKFYSEKVLLSKFCDDILKGEFSVMN